MADRKERPGSIASRLGRIETEDGKTAFDAVRDWLSLENMNYADAAEKIEEEFGLKTSTAALCDFYRKHCSGFKMKRARDYAKQIREQLEEMEDVNFGELTLKQIEQRAFEESFAKDADVDDLQKLTSMLGANKKLQLEWEKLEVQKRRIELLEKKAAFVDELKNRAANREGGLTPEDMEDIEKKLKMM